VLAGLAAAGATALGAGALAAAETITSSPLCCTFSKPTFTIDQGELAVYQNPGGSSHNVTATTNGPDGAELFRSDTISSGQTQVSGTQYLTQGTYGFVCTIHPGMEASLAVTGNGTPLPRPGVALKVLSSKLERVVASRRLKVKVSAAGASDDVAISARKGNRRLASKTGLDLAAGSSRTLKLRLTRAARNALEDLEKAKVRISATVPFGSPASAKRTLR
jgi:plastocyanin